jgi:hypothetical protein
VVKRPKVVKASSPIHKWVEVLERRKPQKRTSRYQIRLFVLSSLFLIVCVRFQIYEREVYISPILENFAA